MSAIYFTNNADDGDGSLRLTLLNNMNGTIAPDETVFGRGATIEIELCSPLDLMGISQCINGGSCRIRLNCDNIHNNASSGSSDLFYINSGSAYYLMFFTNLEIVGFKSSTSYLVGGKVPTGLASLPRVFKWERCLIDGCSFKSISNRATQLYDSVITGCEYERLNDHTVGDAVFGGVGYLGVPADATLDGVQIGEDVRVCKIGAGVEAVTSPPTRPYVADVAWSGADATVPVVVERKTADGWEVIDAQAVGSVALLNLGDETTLRVWDGEKFIEHTPSGEFPFDDYATCDYMFSKAACGTVDAETPDSFDAGNFYVGKNLNVKAALVDSPSEQPVVKDFVDSLSLTVYKVEGTKRGPLAGWFEVDVPASVVSESVDADGFNVDYVSASSPFAEPGDYSAFFVAKFKKGNPATLVMNVAVN